MKLYTTLLFSLFFISFGFSAFSDGLKRDTLKNYEDLVIFETQILQSTHATKFKGINLIYAKQFAKNQSLGLGIELSGTGFHGDNGYHLFTLRFMPIFIDYRHLFFVDHKISIYAYADAGYTFARYTRVEIDNPTNKKKIKEGGIYLSGGVGLKYNLSKHFVPNLSVGFKGYRNSFNNLDINPHGLAFRIGLNYRF